MRLMAKLSSLVLGNLERLFHWWGGVVTRYHSQLELLKEAPVDFTVPGEGSLDSVRGL